MLTIDRAIGIDKNPSYRPTNQSTPLPHERMDARLVKVGTEYDSDVHIHGAAAKYFRTGTVNAIDRNMSRKIPFRDYVTLYT